MTGTRKYEIKRALIAFITELYAANPDTKNVQVAYSAFQPPEADRVHGGRVRSNQKYEYIAGGAVRAPRKETGTVDIHIMTTGLNQSVQETDERCELLGHMLEDAIAADPKFGGRVPDLMWLGIVESDGDSWAETQQVGSFEIYTIGYEARLQ